MRSLPRRRALLWGHRWLRQKDLPCRADPKQPREEGFLTGTAASSAGARPREDTRSEHTVTVTLRCPHAFWPREGIA